MSQQLCLPLEDCQLLFLPCLWRLLSLKSASGSQNLVMNLLSHCMRSARGLWQRVECLATQARLLSCASSTCWGSSSVCSSHGCVSRAMGDCVGACWVPSAVPPSLPGALLALCLHTRVRTGMVPELSPGWNLFGLAVTMSFGAVVVRRGSLGQPLISRGAFEQPGAVFGL